MNAADRQRERRNRKARESYRRVSAQRIASGEVEGTTACGACGAVGHNRRTCPELPEDKAEALTEAMRLMAAAQACWRRAWHDGAVIWRPKGSK